VEAHKVLRRRGSQIFYTIGSQMAVMLSAICASRPFFSWRFLISISVRGWVHPRAIVGLEGLGELKSPHRVSIWRLFFFGEAIGTVATPGLLCYPRVIVEMIVEKQMECRLAGETEVLRENLPQRHFRPSQNPTWPDPGLNLGRRGGKPATNRLRYGSAIRRPSFF
jgi:hypothetical protein